MAIGTIALQTARFTKKWPGFGLYAVWANGPAAPGPLLAEFQEIGTFGLTRVTFTKMWPGFGRIEALPPQ